MQLSGEQMMRKSIYFLVPRRKQKVGLEVVWVEGLNYLLLNNFWLKIDMEVPEKTRLL